RVVEKRKPPRLPSGETQSRFLAGMPGQGGWLSGRAIPTCDTWSLWASAAHRSASSQGGLEQPLTPWDVRACLPFLRGLGDCSRLRQTTTSPGASLHPARSLRRCIRLFAKPDHPSDHVGETLGIPWTTSPDLPSVLHPKVTVSRGLAGAGSPTNFIL